MKKYLLIIFNILIATSAAGYLILPSLDIYGFYSGHPRNPSNITYINAPIIIIPLAIRAIDGVFSDGGLAFQPMIIIGVPFTIWFCLIFLGLQFALPALRNKWKQHKVVVDQKLEGGFDRHGDDE